MHKIVYKEPESESIGSPLTGRLDVELMSFNDLPSDADEEKKEEVVDEKVQWNSK